MSPDERLIVTGTSARRGKQSGVLGFFDTENFEQVAQIGVSQSSVIRTAWPGAINQIIATSGDGDSHVFFDTEFSQKGALQCIVKAPRK